MIEGPEGDIFKHRRHKQLAFGILKDQPDFAPHSREVGRLDSQAAYTDTSLSGKQSVQVKDKGRLTAAVSAQQCHAFTLAQVKVNANQRRSTVVIGVP